MKKITFDCQNNILVGGDLYGKLEFDSDKKAWVLWFDSCYGEEGVTYFEDLKETKEYIVNEIYFAEKEKKKGKAKQ